MQIGDFRDTGRNAFPARSYGVIDLSVSRQAPILQCGFVTDNNVHYMIIAVFQHIFSVEGVILPNSTVFYRYQVFLMNNFPLTEILCYFNDIFL